MPSAWVLNLDADLELAGGPRYSPTNAVRAAMTAHVAVLSASLLAPGDVRIDESSPPGLAAGLDGRAFCPTSRAVALLARAGARVVPHPTQAVLREVNGRAFCAALGPTLPGGAFVRSLDEAQHLLAGSPPIARQWRAKRAFGMAGRGQRPIAAGIVGEADRAFLRSAIRSEGGIMIEPDVAIVRELGIHGVVGDDGTFRLGRLVQQRCDAHGQWLETVPAGEGVGARTRTAIEDEARHVAGALHGAGYFGPFGVDAFEYRDLQGALLLQPRSEINARYSMGFVTGFGAVTA